MKISVVKVECVDALRGTFRRPLLSICKFIILATCVAVVAATFGVYNSFMLKTLPFRDSDRLVVVGQHDASRGLRPLNYYAYKEVKTSRSALEDFGMATFLNAKVEYRGESASVYGGGTSANYFDLIGAKVAMGDIYREDSAFSSDARTAMLSYAMWEQFFGAAEAIVGEYIVVNERVHRVAGVLVQGFALPGRPVSDEPQIFVPITADDLPEERLKSRFNRGIGRLAKGATLRQLSDELFLVNESVEAVWPKIMVNKPIMAVSLREQVSGRYRDELNLLLGAAVLVVLVATVNLLVMSLAEVTLLSYRQRIKNSVGGSWIHLTMGILLLNSLLSIGGTAVGFGASSYIVAYIARSVPNLPVAVTVMDWEVVGVALLVGLTVCAVVSIFSFLYIARHFSTSGTGKPAAGNRIVGSRIGRSFILAEVAGSTVCLIVVGLMLSSGFKRMNVERKAPVDSLYTMGTIMSELLYPSTLERNQIVSRYIEALEAMPHVESAVVGELAPTDSKTDYLFIDDLDTVPVEESSKGLRRMTVSPGYFDTMGLEILRGRAFDLRDNLPEAPRTIVINKAAAEKFWPDRDPVGRRIWILHRSDSEWAEIIGICENDYSSDGNPSVYPYGYRPSATYLFPQAPMLIRTTLPGLVVKREEEEKALRSVDPEARLSWYESGESFLAFFRWFSDTVMRLLAVFAIVVAVLVTVGILAFYFFNLSQRSAEFSLRLCLGATKEKLRNMLFGRSLRDAVCGFLIGAAGAYFIALNMRSFFYETSALSLEVYGIALAAILAIAVLGTLLPVMIFTGKNLYDALKRGR
ncbi:MAG: ABC transporter permease [Verrucomicrobiota bacterium]